MSDRLQNLGLNYGGSSCGFRLFRNKSWTPLDAKGGLSEPIARRIVACVNACKGLTTEQLESGLIDTALEVFWEQGK